MMCCAARMFKITDFLKYILKKQYEDLVCRQSVKQKMQKDDSPNETNI